MPGSAPGRTTLRRTRRRPPPMVRTASSQTVGSARTACRVLTRTGKKAAVKVMKTMPCSFGGEEQDRDRDQGDRRDGADHLEQRAEQVRRQRERATAMPDGHAQRPRRGRSRSGCGSGSRRGPW